MDTKYTDDITKGKPMNAMRMVSSPMVLVPAYGNTYANEEALRVAWCSGVDFKIKGGPYTSIRDLSELQDHCSSLWIFDYVSGAKILVG